MTHANLEHRLRAAESPVDMLAMHRPGQTSIRAFRPSTRTGATSSSRGSTRVLFNQSYHMDELELRGPER